MCSVVEHRGRAIDRRPPSNHRKAVARRGTPFANSSGKEKAMRNLLLGSVLLLLAAGSSHAQTSPPAPSCADPAYRQLDFWVGDWDATFDAGGGQTGHATNRIARDEYGDCVISEHFAQPDIGYVGGSYSMYDNQTGQWRQTWVDNQGSLFVLTGGPVTGQPYSFELKTVDVRGPAKVFKRMIWQDVKPDSFTWRWQSQEPDGAWKDAWVLKYQRRQKSA
jgi:hypothetical protein